MSTLPESEVQELSMMLVEQLTPLAKACGDGNAALVLTNAAAVLAASMYWNHQHGMDRDTYVAQFTDAFQNLLRHDIDRMGQAIANVAHANGEVS